MATSSTVTVVNPTPASGIPGQAAAPAIPPGKHRTPRPGTIRHTIVAAMIRPEGLGTAEFLRLGDAGGKAKWNPGHINQCTRIMAREYGYRINQTGPAKDGIWRIDPANPYGDEATAPVDAAPAPVDAAPVDAAPVDAAPVDPAPVDAAPVDPAPAPAPVSNKARKRAAALNRAK